MTLHSITNQQVERYNRDGYVMLEGLFDEVEMNLLLGTAKADRALEEHAMALDDGAGGVSKLSLWYVAGDDLYGMFSRCARVVDAMMRLIGHEVYHYHYKMMLKEPRTGGA